MKIEFKAAPPPPPPPKFEEVTIRFTQREAQIVMAMIGEVSNPPGFFYELHDKLYKEGVNGKWSAEFSGPAPRFVGVKP